MKRITMEERYDKSFFISNNMTATLEDYIDNFHTLEDFEMRFPDEMLADDARARNYIEKLLTKYDITPSAASEAANLNRATITKILNKDIKNPSRDTLIAICLGIGATIDEVQYLLKYAGEAPLYPRRKRDVVIWFGFVKEQTVTKVNLALAEREMDLLTNHKAD